MIGGLGGKKKVQRTEHEASLAHRKSRQEHGHGLALDTEGMRRQAWVLIQTAKHNQNDSVIASDPITGMLSRNFHACGVVSASAFGT